MRSVQVLASSPAIWRQGLDLPGVKAVLERVQAINPDNSWIGVADRGGIVRAATNDMLLGQDISARPWFAPEIQGPHIGDVHAAKLLAAYLPPSASGEPRWFVDFAAPIANARRSGTALSALLVDADHFKRVNDVHGHAAGIAALALIAETMRSLLRESDIVARKGAEEFAALLPDTDVVGALRSAEKVDAAMPGLEIPGVGRVSVSCGVAAVGLGHGDVAEVLVRTDRAIYRAKREWRDHARMDAPEPADGSSSRDPKPAIEASRSFRQAGTPLRSASSIALEPFERRNPKHGLSKRPTFSLGRRRRAFPGSFGIEYIGGVGGQILTSSLPPTLSPAFALGVFLAARNVGAPGLRTQRASSIARSARAPSDVSAYTPARSSINRMAARISQSRIGAEARRPGAGRCPLKATRRIDIWASVRQ